MGVLDTGVKNVRNVGGFTIGSGSLGGLSDKIEVCRNGGRVLFLVDEYFSQQSKLMEQIPVGTGDRICFIDSTEEPTTTEIDRLTAAVLRDGGTVPTVIVGIGGGVTLDTTKAVSNLLTNGGQASDYQGWDLVKVPGIYKIGIPTISGTGAEATRTCVMTNKETGLKLGMNSDFTVFDFVVLDPDLTATVPRDQYFWSGMDAYIHCIESLAGVYRNPIGDAYSRQTVGLCREVFGGSDDMQSSENREKLMVASYLGGCAIATSYVGLIHPFSAGLSVVLGTHHCVANCIVMRGMEKFYPAEFEEFWGYVERQGVDIPKGVCSSLTDEQFEALFESTIIHEKPLTNALGPDFSSVLTRDVVREIFETL